MEWIKSGEDIPNINNHNDLTKCVLVYVESNKCCFTAYYSYKKDSWFCFNSGREIFNVTHWMSLPKPPKE